jgi:hypothetical protein
VTLSDLRRLAIRKQFEIHFSLRNGMECVMSRHGVAQVPGLRGVPDFNLEQELAWAGEFLLDPPQQAGKKQPAEAPRRLSREELEKMLGGGAETASAAHEDE